jgi:D-hexose-6-phosphate mutarotase
MPTHAADLQCFEIPGVTFHDTPGGLVRISIATPLATAEVYLQGAHIARYQPAGAAPVLFLSEKTHLAQGKAIRGGVPIIFPWFGARAGHPGSPAHGFARTMEWELESLVRRNNGDIHLVLRLSTTTTTLAQWPHEFTLRHRITIGAQLHLALEVENSGDAPFTFEEALHTYFTVGDVRSSGVTGLENTSYLDKVDAGQRKREGSEPIRFNGETDRVYLDTTTTCTIHDPVLARRIVVEKTGSDTTVVWNPWIPKAKAMADFGDDEWPAMLCIETTNAAENLITLLPKSTHTMTATVSIAS